MAFLIAGLILQAAAFVWLIDRIVQRNDVEVQYLLQRIQDPTAAVAQHVVGEQEYAVSHLPFDDDAAWLAHVEGMNG